MVLEITLDIVLDNDKLTGKAIPKYFPGDAITGKIYISSNQSYKIKNFQLNWSGSVQVQPVQSNRQVLNYFDEKLVLNSVRKSTVKNSNIYHSEFVLEDGKITSNTILELQKNKSVGLRFLINVPNDRPIPSCTEIGASSNKIVYQLKAILGDPSKGSVFYTQKKLPVYEPIYTKTPEMLTHQRIEHVFRTVLDSGLEFFSTMRFILPVKAALPGSQLPLSISLWSKLDCIRKQGVSVSLIRISQVLANGKAYASHGEKIHRIVTDLNITSEDFNNPENKTQVIRLKFPIPKSVAPTITLESSQLLSIHYTIRVQVYAHDGQYTSLTDGKTSQFMTLELPLVLGTRSEFAMASPTFSYRSTEDLISPIPSPSLNNLSLVNSPSLIMSQANSSSIFRSLSNGSNVTKSSSGEERRSLIPSFKIFRNNNNRQENVTATTLTAAKITRGDQARSSMILEPTVLHNQSGITMTTENNVSPTLSHASSATGNESSRVYRSLSDGHRNHRSTENIKEKISENEKSKREVDELVNSLIDSTSSTPEKDKSQGVVFQMFDDDDSDEEEAILEEEVSSLGVSEQKSIINNNQVSPHETQQLIFQYKPNEIDDTQTFQTSRPSNISKSDSFDLTESNEDYQYRKQSNTQSNLQHTHKPNEFDYDSSTSEESDEYDILAAMARRERKKTR